MNAMHTPGPWEIDTDTRPVEVCTIHGVPPQGEDGQKWIYVRGAIGDWDATEETNMANARLIAAAPELLELLQTAVSGGHTLGWQQKRRALLEKIGSAVP